MAHLRIHGPQCLTSCVRPMNSPLQFRPCQPPVPRRICSEAQSECSTSYDPIPDQLWRGWRTRAHAAKRGRKPAEAERTPEPEPAPVRRRTRKTQTPPPPPPPQEDEDDQEEEETPAPPLPIDEPARVQRRGLRSKTSTEAGGTVGISALDANTTFDNSSSSSSVPAISAATAIESSTTPAIPRIEYDDDIWDKLDDDVPPSSWEDLPFRMIPQSEEDQRKLDNEIQRQQYFQRTWEQEDIEDFAFHQAERMRDKAHNIYANTQHVARMMHVLESEDFRMGEKQTHWSSWARAEILFATEYDEFNRQVKEKMNRLVPQPLEEEVRDRLEAIGEATLLPPTESEQLAPKFPSDADVARRAQEQLLEGILPGVSLANPMQRFADDIYAGDGGEEAADELLGMIEGDAEEEAADAE